MRAGSSTVRNGSREPWQEVEMGEQQAKGVPKELLLTAFTTSMLLYFM